MRAGKLGAKQGQCIDERATVNTLSNPASQARARRAIVNPSRIG
jgi:hypothetical protein